MEVHKHIPTAYPTATLKGMEECEVQVRSLQVV